MLTADQITALGDKAERITEPIVEFLIEDIARRVSEAGQLTSTASYQVWRLQNLGLSQDQVKKEIQKRLGVSLREVERLMTQAAEVGYNFDLSRLPHADAVPFADNETVQQIVSAAVQMAQDDLSNMVQTLGFVTQNGRAEPLTQAYQQACDFAFQKVAMGAQDYNSAIREATRELASKGIRAIDYESGRSTTIEAAVRRNVMGALGTMQAEISQQNHDDLGCDGWEISAHGASAPDHEPIQGKQYTDAKYNALNRSLIRRIGTLNCGHAAFPIILGVNEPQYSAAELEQFRQANEKGVDYEGKHYTMYEATQRQRKLERAIRNRKRRILIDQTTGDKERLAIDQTRLVILNDEYARFTKAAKLRSQRERANVPGFGQKQATEAKAEAKKAESRHSEWLKSIGAEKTEFKSLAFYEKAKYNGSPDYKLLHQYAADVESGWVSPLSGFENYRTLYNRIQTEVVGKVAADGTLIAGQVPHFMQRVIGTMVDPEKLKRDLKVIRRSGVSVDSIVETVFHPLEIGDVQVRKSGKRSVKLIGENCAVTINPDTGMLIQTNPL